MPHIDDLGHTCNGTVTYPGRGRKRTSGPVSVRPRRPAARPAWRLNVLNWRADRWPLRARGIDPCLTHTRRTASTRPRERKASEWSPAPWQTQLLRPGIEVLDTARGAADQSVEFAMIDFERSGYFDHLRTQPTIQRLCALADQGDVWELAGTIRPSTNDGPGWRALRAARWARRCGVSIPGAVSSSPGNRTVRPRHWPSTTGSTSWPGTDPRSSLRSRSSVFLPAPRLQRLHAAVGNGSQLVRIWIARGSRRRLLQTRRRSYVP
jgi:hypothetical protein